jgi:hypothetical protein
MHYRKDWEMEPQISSFGKVLDDVMNLPTEQRRMLIDIVERREIETWREETAREAAEARRAFHAGELNPQTADEIISDLERSLNEDESE